MASTEGALQAHRWRPSAAEWQPSAAGEQHSIREKSTQGGNDLSFTPHYAQQPLLRAPNKPPLQLNAHTERIRPSLGLHISFQMELYTQTPTPQEKLMNHGFDSARAPDSGAKAKGNTEPLQRVELILRRQVDAHLLCQTSSCFKTSFCCVPRAETLNILEYLIVLKVEADVGS